MAIGLPNDEVLVLVQSQPVKRCAKLRDVMGDGDGKIEHAVALGQRSENFLIKLI